MLLSLDFWNLVIATLALIISIYAVVYTHLQNKLSIGISNGFYDRRNPDPFMFGFTIENLSSKSIRLVSLSMSDEKGLKVDIIEDFEPTQTYIVSGYTKIPDIIHPYWDAEPFQSPVNFQPNSEINFSYYTGSNPPNELHVTAIFESLSLFKKKKKYNLVVSLKKND